MNEKIDRIDQIRDDKTETYAFQCVFDTSIREILPVHASVSNPSRHTEPWPQERDFWQSLSTFTRGYLNAWARVNNRNLCRCWYHRLNSLRKSNLLLQYWIISVGTCKGLMKTSRSNRHDVDLLSFSIRTNVANGSCRYWNQETIYRDGVKFIGLPSLWLVDVRCTTNRCFRLFFIDETTATKRLFSEYSGPKRTTRSSRCICLKHEKVLPS